MPHYCPVLQCVFPTNRDILPHNYNITIKIRKLMSLPYYNKVLGLIQVPLIVPVAYFVRKRCHPKWGSIHDHGDSAHLVPMSAQHLRQSLVSSKYAVKTHYTRVHK